MKWIKPNWTAPSNIHGLTTTRLLGQINLSLSSQSLVQQLNLPAEPFWIHQVHSNIVIRPSLQIHNKNADASITDQKNLICAILTADCLPILLSHKKGLEVAAIHAGWKGLAKGIIKNTISALTYPPQEYLAWLGPAISQSKFEVGRDVYDIFLKNNKENEVAFIKHSAQKWLANLYTLAKIQLNHFSIHEIFTESYCTFSQEKLFYSYRRNRLETGRMISLIWMS